MKHEYDVVKSGLYLSIGEGRSKKAVVEEAEKSEKSFLDNGEYDIFAVKKNLGILNDYGYEDYPTKKIKDHFFVSSKNTSQIKGYILKDLKVFEEDILNEEAAHDIQGRNIILEWKHIENNECAHVTLRGTLDRVRNICNPTGPDIDTYIKVNSISQVVTDVNSKPRMFSTISYA